MSSIALPSQKKDLVFSHLNEINELQNLIPSRIKNVCTLGVRMDDSLKVKRRVLVLIGRGLRLVQKKEPRKRNKLLSTASQFKVGDFP